MKKRNKRNKGKIGPNDVVMAARSNSDECGNGIWYLIRGIYNDLITGEEIFVVHDDINGLRQQFNRVDIPANNFAYKKQMFYKEFKKLKKP